VLQIAGKIPTAINPIIHQSSNPMLGLADREREFPKKSGFNPLKTDQF